MSASLIMSEFSASSALSSRPICGEAPLPVPAMAERSGAEADDDRLWRRVFGTTVPLRQCSALCRTRR